MVNARTKRGGAGTTGVTLVATVAFLAAPLLLPAQDLSNEKLAAVTIASDGVDFLTLVDHGGAILRISGAGEDHFYTFGPGESPWLGAFGAEGEPLTDGVYTWELELLPVPEAREELMKAAAKSNGAAPQAMPRQSGAFTIADGFLADPDLREPVKVPVPRSIERGEESHHGFVEASEPSEPMDTDASFLAGHVERGASAFPAAAPARAPGDALLWEDSDETTATLGGSVQENTRIDDSETDQQNDRRNR